mgnify:CR=1 FL=1
MSDLTGELIDNRYLLQRLIASGGMATIYAGMDTRLDRPVAVKIMHAHLANDEAFVSRFIKEAKATAALSHPNIVSIQDQGWNEGGPPAVFLVMELVEGSTLRDFLNQQGSVSIEQMFQLMSPVLSALAVAHKIGIIHRDIKPENILISKDGRVKVADFGLARNMAIGQTMTVESSVVLGSVSYLSPEQVQRGVADARSDIYAVGIVLFEMLTGGKPYEGETPIQIAYRHVNDRIPTLQSVKSDIPITISDLVHAATAPNPDHRPKDAEELLNKLREIQAQIDPRKRQMSLELDLPPSIMKSVAKRGKVSVGSALEGLKEKTSQLISTKPIKVSKPEDSIGTKKLLRPISSNLAADIGQEEKTKSQAKPTPRKNPKHDTEVDNNTDFKYWQGKNLTVIKDQLNKRGYRKHRTPDGRSMRKADYLAELHKMLDENTWLMMG